MIYTDRQFQITRTELAKLEAALAGIPSKQDWVQKAQYDALQSQVSDLQADMAEYEMLKLGKVAFAETCSLRELPRVLVQARIARGFSQTDLADRLNMKPQQVQRYEATNYMSASLSRLIEVASILSVKVSESFEAAHNETSGAIFAWHNAEDVSWSRLPIKEMVKRGWLSVAPNESPIVAVRNFFVQAAGPQFATALHRKKVRAGNVPNEFALLAWQARVLHVARRLQEANPMKTFELNDTWLGELTRLTRQKDGPTQARELLAEKGITLVVERHLPGTYLDGAAMLSASSQPVIALTLRYDRLDNFWFVLFHEVGHVFLHLMQGLRFDFFDEENGDKTDRIELEADDFALNTLIPATAWEQCLSRFVLTEEAVLTDADNLGISASIIAGRIRKERNDFTLLTRLVGQDSVRKQLETKDGT
ncbi:XRE family transcriptional regulator [Bradyrhizobium sp. 76]|uniref:helix-turn-helix domain-containing protein n=1 Tax=Bradyrhizobium sp. 76 TaxID=2782680 RepID=UPI001FFB1D9C|nr:XRE family transcriptional regulator [Bradyrhizobium sp. 76]MCK1409296.1 helix-turn-helix domain-containing protein [Bradyrhizobium sp. 76]